MRYWKETSLTSATKTCQIERPKTIGLRPFHCQDVTGRLRTFTLIGSVRHKCFKVRNNLPVNIYSLKCYVEYRISRLKVSILA